MLHFLFKRLIAVAFLTYTVMILANLFNAYIPKYDEHPLMQLSITYTTPYLSLFHPFVPSLGPVELSPIAALFSLQIAKWVLLAIL